MQGVVEGCDEGGGLQSYFLVRQGLAIQSALLFYC